MPKLNPKEIENYLREMAGIYRAPLDVIAGEVERAFNQVLSLITGYEIETWILRNGCGSEIKIWAFTGPWYDSRIKMLNPEDISTNTVKLICSRLRHFMRDYGVRDHFGTLLHLHHRVYEGRISRTPVPGAALSVDIAVESDSGLADTVTATCPYKFQPPGERNRYRIGQTCKFYVHQVRLNGKHRETRIEVELSRTSIKLPEVLLRDSCYENTGRRRMLRCTKRVLGFKTEILVSEPIPRSILQEVQREIGEYLVVFVKPARLERRPHAEGGIDPCSV
ncbi:MAG: hypothetical protein ACE14T_05350 [Syntrophales bacterium]